jgi:CBS domain-containing protein
MSLRDAASLLLRSRISGAPVVDAAGRCIGVLSAIDFLRIAKNRDGMPHSPHPITSSFQTDWQIVEMEVEVEKLPVDDVRRFMTTDPVTTEPETSIGTIARKMIDARVHWVIVVNAEQKPIGVVSSTDILGALATTDRGRQV